MGYDYITAFEYSIYAPLTTITIFISILIWAEWNTIKKKIKRWTG